MAKKKTPIEPWDMQPDETFKAFEAFQTYRDLGLSRTIPKVSQALKKNMTTLTEWSGKYNWVERAKAWDTEQDRIMQRNQLEEIKKMRKRHAKMAYDMIEKAARALSTIPDDEIKAGDISRMVDVASKLERISRGDAGEVIEERNGGDAINPVQIYIPDNHRSDTAFDDLEV